MPWQWKGIRKREPRGWRVKLIRRDWVQGRPQDSGCYLVEIQGRAQWGGWVRPTRRTRRQVKPAGQHLLHERDVVVLRWRRGMRWNHRGGLNIFEGLLNWVCVGGLLDRVFQLPDSAQEGVLQGVPQGHPQAGCQDPAEVCQFRLNVFYFA